MAALFQALDTFNAAIVAPVYYVMFTTLTIIASVIMFKVDCLIYILWFSSDAFIGCFHAITKTWDSEFPVVFYVQCRIGLVRM